MNMNTNAPGYDNQLAPPGGEKETMPAPGIDTQRIWYGITGQMWAREPGTLERAVARLAGSPALARALIATPSLFLAWLVASALTFVLGAVLMGASGWPIVPLLAPVMAGAGVAFAYGTAADPAWEITRTVALPERLLLLARVLVVFVTDTVIGLLATLVTPRGADLTLLWLLPMTTIALVALAAAVTTNSPLLGCLIGMVVWLAFLMRGSLVDVSLTAVSATTIRDLAPIYLALAAASTVLIVHELTSATARGRRR